MDGERADFGRAGIVVGERQHLDIAADIDGLAALDEAEPLVGEEAVGQADMRIERRGTEHRAVALVEHQQIMRLVAVDLAAEAGDRTLDLLGQHRAIGGQGRHARAEAFGERDDAVQVAHLGRADGAHQWASAIGTAARAARLRLFWRRREYQSHRPVADKPVSDTPESRNSNCVTVPPNMPVWTV